MNIQETKKYCRFTLKFKLIECFLMFFFRREIYGKGLYCRCGELHEQTPSVIRESAKRISYKFVLSAAFALLEFTGGKNKL